MGHRNGTNRHTLRRNPSQVEAGSDLSPPFFCSSLVLVCGGKKRSKITKVAHMLNVETEVFSSKILEMGIDILPFNPNKVNWFPMWITRIFLLD